MIFEVLAKSTWAEEPEESVFKRAKAPERSGSIPITQVESALVRVGSSAVWGEGQDKESNQPDSRGAAESLRLSLEETLVLEDEREDEEKATNFEEEEKRRGL